LDSNKVKWMEFQLNFLILDCEGWMPTSDMEVLKLATGLCSKEVLDTVIPWRIILSPYFISFET
jgi:hypothetical protein